MLIGWNGTSGPAMASQRTDRLDAKMWLGYKGKANRFQGGIV